MASGIFNIGVSGLNAAQAGVLTTSHNIANASTPGFSRQRVQQTTAIPLYTGAGVFGQGASVETVTRVYDKYLAAQLLAAQTNSSEADSHLAQINQIDNLLADPNAGLSPALSSFFNGLQEVAANPASVPARQALLAAGQSLAARFQSIDQRLREVRSGINSQIGDQVSIINSYAQQIADINLNLVRAQASGNGNPANDLLDQRDQLVADLNKQVRVTTLVQGDGTLSVFIGNGQPLVVGTTVNKLAAVAAPDDPEKTVVATVNGSGTAIILPDSLLTGGALGGLLAFRSQSLDSVQNALGRISLTLAQNFNDQHQLGQDLTGALGGNFFDVSLAGPTVRANTANTGSGAPTATISSVSALTTSDYTLTYTGANYTLVRLSDNTSQTFASLPQTVDGVDIALGTWAPAAGDSVLIQPTRAGAGNLALAVTDARNIAAAAPIRTSAALANTGTASINGGTVNAPPPPDPNLTQTVTLTFTGAGTFDVNGVGTGNPSGVAYTTGGNITYNGWTVQITGTPRIGDVFTVSANAGGVADNRNAVLLGNLQSATTVAGGTASYQSAYSQVVAQVGNKAREVSVASKAQQSLADQAQSARDQISGVNLDEEAANLLRYQQAYQASAKMLDIATKLFDQVLALGK
jgi:flagellar hook-associated protein 1 FlgK